MLLLRLKPLLRRLGNFPPCLMEHTTYIVSNDENVEGSAPRFRNAHTFTFSPTEGETDITEQVVLNGAGMLPEGRNATYNWDDEGVENGGKATFEDVDGLEVFQAADGNLYLMIQEDSGNNYGDRVFITSPLEHEADGKDLTYYFVAMSGGKANSRAIPSCLYQLELPVTMVKSSTPMRTNSLACLI
jgi:hypothetical protein